MASWRCYIIENGGCTYVGVTPYLSRRLRQHNGEITGGAKYTTSKGPGWRHMCVVDGFKSKRDALQFEWAVKHCGPRKGGGMPRRLQQLRTVLSRHSWTSKARAASTVPLTVKLYNGCCFPATDLPDYVTVV